MRGAGETGLPSKTMPPHKSTPEEIRRRFDAEVERFSNLETGQTATVDAPLSLDLIAKAARGVNPQATTLLDIGCGAGNYTLKLLQHLPLRSVTLVDLSRAMLDRATERIHAAAPAVEIHAMHSDIRDTILHTGAFDVAVAAAALHHLRETHEWNAVYATVYRTLRPGGSFWVSDLVSHSSHAVQDAMWQRYGDYLESLQGPEYRDRVFGYIEAEDTPRPLFWQLELLSRTGFRDVDVLHKNSCFAAFGAIK
jgi:tRNA (cmo5U34)-methyltransferase